MRSKSKGTDPTHHLLVDRKVCMVNHQKPTSPSRCPCPFLPWRWRGLNLRPGNCGNQCCDRGDYLWLSSILVSYCETESVGRDKGALWLWATSCKGNYHPKMLLLQTELSHFGGFCQFATSFLLLQALGVLTFPPTFSLPLSFFFVNLASDKFCLFSSFDCLRVFNRALNIYILDLSLPQVSCIWIFFPVTISQRCILLLVQNIMYSFFGVIFFFFGTFAILEKTGSITLQTFQYLLVIYWIFLWLVCYSFFKVLQLLLSEW